jgi:hypothetical protein
VDGARPEGNVTARVMTCDAAEVRGLTDNRRATPGRVILQVLRVGAALVLVFVVARAAYFPIWAAGADSDELARSWGGPNPLWATLAHWFVAALIGAVCVGLLVVSSRLLRPRR